MSSFNGQTGAVTIPASPVLAPWVPAENNLIAATSDPAGWEMRAQLRYSERCVWPGSTSGRRAPSRTCGGRSWVTRAVPAPVAIPACIPAAASCSAVLPTLGRAGFDSGELKNGGMRADYAVIQFAFSSSNPTLNAAVPGSAESALQNFNLPAAESRWGSITGVGSSLPATFTPSSIITSLSNGQCFWAGAS